MNVGDLVRNSYAGEDYEDLIGVIIDHDLPPRQLPAEVAIYTWDGHIEMHYEDELEVIHEIR